jgi:hypothetical protein
MRTENPLYAVTRCTATRDIAPQIAENKQWRHVGVWLYFNQSEVAFTQTDYKYFM